jgi:predicted DNA-binding ribbon-helix-helix protein
MQLKRTRTKRSTFVAGRGTSVNVEAQFWEGLREIAEERGLSLGELVTSIDANRRRPNLSSAIRLFVLDHYRNQISARQP